MPPERFEPVRSWTNGPAHGVNCLVVTGADGTPHHVLTYATAPQP